MIHGPMLDATDRSWVNIRRRGQTHIDNSAVSYRDLLIKQLAASGRREEEENTQPPW
ncbi:unnamed protein product [Linum tenue]|uniref:Uncharacterized protein n=1 Tax=Linum tenue TaxID=586396 RepID=A0AAV0QQD0_9ROSI|nr:unnamed protein product [Linum tenue]